MTYSEEVEYVKTEVRVAKHKRNWWREVPSERGKAHNAVPYLARARSTNTLAHTLHHNQFANVQSGYLSRPLAAQLHYLYQHSTSPIFH